MSKGPHRARQPKPIRRLLYLHATLLACIALGVGATLLMPHGWPVTARALAGWDIGILAYLGAVLLRVAPCKIDQIKRRAAIEDEGAVAVLILTMIAAFASLVALVVLLGGKAAGADASAWRLMLAPATIVLSWFFIHTTFTLHYAHEYYGDRSDARTGGLKFPGNESPDYWDFFYFSLVIAMTSQVSDVAITGKIIRRVATLHGVLSFFFNLGILALTINMLASALS